jgi:hypothetical protein
MLLQFRVLDGVSSELGADGEELALDSQDGGVPLAIADQRSGDAERRDRLIDRAIRLRTGVGFRDATAVEQARFACITGLGNDALARDGDDALRGAAREDLL